MHGIQLTSLFQLVTFLLLCLMVKFGWRLPSYMVTTYDATCQIHSTPTCMVYNLHLYFSWLLFCYSVNGEIWLEVTSYMVTTYDATCQIHSTLTCIVCNLHLLSWLLFCYSVNGEIWLEVTQLHGYNI